MFPRLRKAEATAIVAGLARLEADPALLEALQRRSFIEKGLDLVDGPDCPLCDHPWGNEEHLREHLKSKLARSEEAGRLQAALLKAGADIAREAVRLVGLLSPPLKIAESQGGGAFARLLSAWTAELEELKAKLSNWTA